MKPLRFTRPHNRDKLTDELTALPTLAPVPDQADPEHRPAARFVMSDDGETINLWVADDADVAAITAAITAHTNPPAVPFADPDIVLLRRIRALHLRAEARRADAQAQLDILNTAGITVAQRNAAQATLAQLQVGVWNTINDLCLSIGSWVNDQGKDEPA